MAKTTEISWCDSTFNPWQGCTKVSPGCAHCYAEARDQRFTGGQHWGKGAPRQRTSAANWKEPVKWNKRADLGLFIQCDGCGRREFRKWDGALPPGGLSCCSTPECLALPESEANPVTPRVFCASLADWLDNEVPIDWTAQFLELVHDTPSLDWQLLTKRPALWEERIHFSAAYHFDYGSRNVAGWLTDWLKHGVAPANVWIGVSVEDQQRADERIPELLKIPAWIRFLSCEPLLGPVKLTHNVDWVICGGESGPHARPMHPEWARSLRDQCQSAGAPFFFKQWGEWKPFDSLAEAIDPVNKYGEDKNLCVLWETGVSGSAILSNPCDAWMRGCRAFRKVGKNTAGNVLDGRTWNEFPR